MRRTNLDPPRLSCDNCREKAPNLPPCWPLYRTGRGESTGDVSASQDEIEASINAILAHGRAYWITSFPCLSQPGPPVPLLPCQRTLTCVKST